MYRAEHIPLPAEEGFTALAWCMPDMLLQWGGRIREVAIDSAWETNGSRFELYAPIGEAYGSRLPLGFILLASNGGASGGTQHHLTPFLKHFETNYGIEPVVGLSDKYFPEINSMQVSLSGRKHQLCFWHGVTALKKRLTFLR
ncbi:hypothetical protein K439DRAFT_1623434 [Ramaria rubella]|nr:hypothetical protein K439DRAFT_1623434 [Ramaria rubella]